MTRACRAEASSRRRVAVLFGVAAAARAIYLLVFRPPLESYYLALANSLVGTGVLGFGGTPSTAFEPVYPMFLAAGQLIFGGRAVLIQLLQVCVAASGAAMLYYLTLELTASRRTATWAGALFALHPLLIRQASAASDLALTTTLVIGVALAFVRIRGVRSAAAAGVILGVTVLTRSMVLPLMFLAAAILLVRRQRSQTVAFTLAALAVIGPMLVRNYRLTGSLSPTRSGINLYIGNSPHTAALLPTYDLDLLEPAAYERFAQARPDTGEAAPHDAAFDAPLTRLAVQHMLGDPMQTLRQKLLNVVYLLSPRVTPFRISGRDTRMVIDENGTAHVIGSVARSPLEVWSYAAAASLLLAGAVAGIVSRRRLLHRDAILWAIAVTFIGVNAVYVPATRYMAPMLFVMMFYTAVALGTGSRLSTSVRERVGDHCVTDAIQ